MVFLVIIMGAVYYQDQRNNHFKDTYRELETVSYLKTAQIEEWLTERKSDAMVLASGLDITGVFEDYVEGSDVTGRVERLESHLAYLKLHYGYEDVFVLDSKGKIISGTEKALAHMDEVTQRVLREAVQTGNVVFSDFYFCQSHQRIHLDISAPLPGSAGEKGITVLLRIDPEDFLYPALKSWPLLSETSETLLARWTDSDTLEFINELRFVENSALRFRLSRSENGETPAIKAATGHRGIYRGTDYRGERVLSWLSQVPGTNWFMINKKDIREVVKELRYNEITTTGVVVGLIIVIVLFTAWRYNLRSKQILEESLEKEQKISHVNKLFRVTLYSIGDAVITTDCRGKVIQMNPVAEYLTGWAEKEARDMNLESVFVIINEDTRDKVSSPVERVLAEGMVVGLANHTLLLSRDGREIPIADSGAPIRNEEGEITGVVLVFRDQTEERRVQKSIIDHAADLNEANRRLSTLLANLPGIAYRCHNDRQWTMEFISEGCQWLTGYNQDELIRNASLSFNDIILPIFRDYVWNTIQAAVKERKSYQLTYKIRTKNGDEKWVWEQGTPVFRDGDIVAMEGFISDITERKRAEEILQDNEKRFRSLLEISQQDTRDIQELLDYALHEALKLTSSSLGYIYHYDEEKEEFILNTWSRGVLKDCSITDPPDCYELSKTGIWGEAVRQRREIVVNDFQAENPLKKGYPEGHAELFNYLTVPVFDKNQIVAVVGVANKEGGYTDMDVNQLKLLMASVWKMTERKKSDELVLQMSKALEQSPVSIVITNSDGKIIYVNPSFTSVTGYSHGDVQARMSRILNQPDKNKLEAIWQTLKAGRQWKGEYRNRKKTGEPFWEMVSIQAVTDETGNTVNYVIVSEDITERKNLMAELIEARDKAEEMNRLKSRFLANMSHELRTPMNGIMGFSELLTLEEDQEEIRNMSEIINRSAKRLMQTLNSILDLSRIESGAGEPVYSMTDIAALTRETFELFRAEAEKKGLILRIEGTDSPVLINTDQRIAADIISNLISNAVKFTFEGKVELILKGTDREDKGYITIEVHDTGIGIREEDREMIFDEFRQGSEGYSRSFEGSGLGLSLCKKYLNMLGGSITFTSVPGKGTIFSVTLPV